MKKVLLVVCSLWLTSFAMNAQKYAIIDTKYILDKLPDYKDAQTKLDAIAAGWQKEIDDQQADLDKMYRDFEAEQVMLNDELKKKREDQLFNKYQLELRYPFATNPQSTIYGLAFFEAANGWYSFKEYNPFRLRRSAGVGMRFFLPMFGLLGFDYGIGIDRIQPGQGLKSASKFTFMLGYEPE